MSLPRVLIFGTFDGLHPGHRFVLDEACKRGALTVVVGRDANVLAFKGRSPVHPEQERMKMIQEAYHSVTVVLGHPTDFLAPVREVAPDLIFLGYDQCLPPGIAEADFPCPLERLPAFEPHIHKSSLYRR